MTYNEVKVILETHIRDNWLETPVFFDNIELNDNIQEAFIRVSIEFPRTEFLSIGDTSLRRVFGKLRLDVFDLVGTGSGYATELCQTLADLFTGAKIQGIQFNAPTISNNGAIEKWYWMAVYNTFYFEIGV